MRSRIPVAALVAGTMLAASTVASQARKADDHQHPVASASKVTKAVAVLHPTEGNDVNGTVTFSKTDDGVRVQAEIRGLSPGKHGFHVHQFGDLTDPAAESAGGHFSPRGEPHGAPDDEKRHVGDLGNIEANDSGEARLDVVDHVLSLDGPTSIIGRAVIVHEGADDLESQPSGDAGSRVAGGVIGIAAEE